MTESDSTAQVMVLEKPQTNIEQAWANIDSIESRIKDAGLEGSFIVGGGLVYESKKYETEPVRDIDGMFMFADRASLNEFVANYSPEHLAEVFGFDKDSVDSFTETEVQFFVENNIEVMRVSGTIDGAKTTVKLTDAQTVCDERIDAPMRVLSKKKDKRIYERKDIKGNDVQVLLQNVSIPGAEDRSYVIRDRTYFRDGDTLVEGLITDYFVTAQTRDENDTLFSQVQQFHRDRFVRVFAEGSTRERDWSKLLSRGDRFSEKYRDRLNSDLNRSLSEQDPSQLLETVKPCESGFIFDIEETLPESTVPNFEYKSPDKEVKCKALPTQETLAARVREGIEIVTGGSTVDHVYFLEQQQFSSNGQVGQATDAEGRIYFFKTPKETNLGNVQSEVENKKNLKQLYPNVQDYTFWTEDFSVVASPWIDGELEAIKILRASPEDCVAVLNTELRRSEEMRKGYQASVTQLQTEGTQDERVHELHHKRLTGERFEKYYANASFTLPSGEVIQFAELQKMKFVVNGVRYGSLEGVLQMAEEHLDPDKLDSHIKVYGFGDNHAGNVMITSEDGVNYTNFDYEFGGVQPPEEDIAKNVYNDVYGRLTLFAGEVDGVQVDIQNGELHINYDSKLSELEEQMLEIKLRGILFPTLDYAKSQGLNIDNWEEIFRSSLVTSAMLNKNIAGYDNQRMWYGLAIASQIGNKQELSPNETFTLNRLIAEYKYASEESEVLETMNDETFSTKLGTEKLFDINTPLSEIFNDELRGNTQNIERVNIARQKLDIWMQVVGFDNAQDKIANYFSSGQIKDETSLVAIIESLAYSPQVETDAKRVAFARNILEKIRTNNTREISDDVVQELDFFTKAIEGNQDINLEIGHMMIKPEGVENFPEGLRAELELVLTANGLDYVFFTSKLTEFQAKRLYSEKGLDPRLFPHLTGNETSHLFVRGKDATKIIEQARGKWIDSKKIEKGMTQEEIAAIPGTGIRKVAKEASRAIGFEEKKWTNYIHGSVNNSEALRGMLFI